MPNLPDLDFPEIRAVLKSLQKMPSTDDCISVADGFTKDTSLKPGADDRADTPLDRASWLAGAMENYHDSLDLLKRALHENVAAIKLYGSDSTPDTIQQLETRRAAVQSQLEVMRENCQDVGEQLAHFKQIQGVESLDFTKQLTAAVGVIGPRLDAVVQRLAEHPLDMKQFDQAWKAEGRVAAQAHLVDRALTPRGRAVPYREHHAAMAVYRPQRSRLKNEVAEPPSSQPDPKVIKRRSR